MAGLSLRNICKVNKGNENVVQNLNLEIEDKELIALVGPSDCGKSAVLRMIAGLDDITSGDLLMDEKRVNSVPAKERDVAIVRTETLRPRATAYKNMAAALKELKLGRSESDRRIREAAGLLGIDSVLDSKVQTLTADQRLRVALGGAIARKPKVLLLDDPLTELDSGLRTRTRWEIARLHEQLQITFLYVTHDQGEAMMMGARVAVMKGGSVQQVDTPQRLYDYPANLSVASFIGMLPMNIFRARLVKQGDGIFAQFGENSIRVPTGKIQRMTGDYIGKEVYMGIRPENLHDEDAFLSTYPDACMEMRVERIEQLGCETHLLMTASGKEGSIVARVDPRTNARVGDTVSIGLDVNRLHFFDVESEKSILSRD